MMDPKQNTFRVISRHIMSRQLGDTFGLPDVARAIENEISATYSASTISRVMAELTSAGWLERISYRIWRRAEPKPPEPQPTASQIQLSDFTFEQLSAEIVRRMAAR